MSVNAGDFAWPDMIRKSFLIGPLKLDAPPENRLLLDNGMYFVWQKDLRVTRVIGRKTGREAVLCGIAIQQDSEKPSPEDILREETLDIRESVASWGGRWFLYRNGEFYHDFFTTSGVFYSASAVSNCFAELRKYLGLAQPDPKNFFRYGHGIDFIPGPGTLLPEIKKLLPTQRLIRRDGVFSAEFQPPKPVLRDAGPEEVLDFAVNRVGTFLKECEKQYDTLWLPLSGGYDSRTVLGIALHAGVALKAYTCIKDVISLPDNRYPGRLCAAHGLEHFRLYRKLDRMDPPVRRAERFDRHTSGLCMDRDREYFMYRQIPAEEGRSAVIGSVVWDTLHNFCKSSLPLDTDVNLPAEQVFSRFAETTPQILGMLEEYLQFVRLHPLENVPFFRRYYYEQRVACWASVIDQAWDLYPMERLQPANSEQMAACILRIAELFPQAYTGQTALLRRIAPELLKLPFNTPQYSLLYRATRRIRNRIRAYFF